MFFGTKGYLKNNRYYTLKYLLNLTLLMQKFKACVKSQGFHIK